MTKNRVNVRSQNASVTFLKNIYTSLVLYSSKHGHIIILIFCCRGCLHGWQFSPTRQFFSSKFSRWECSTESIFTFVFLMFFSSPAILDSKISTVTQVIFVTDDPQQGFMMDWVIKSNVGALPSGPLVAIWGQFRCRWGLIPPRRLVRFVLCKLEKKEG